MGALVSYPTLSNPVTLFATVAAANAFFTQFAVSSASSSAEGVVKKATLPAAINTTVTLAATTVNVLNEDGTITQYTVCSYADAASLLFLLNELKTAYNNLRSAMINAGQGA